MHTRKFPHGRLKDHPPARTITEARETVETQRRKVESARTRIAARNAEKAA